MINGIGSGGSGRIGTARTGAAGRSIDAGSISSANSDAVATAAALSNPAQTLASMGAPIDTAKIQAIRTAIAEGRYPVNPRAIAERMVELDLPLKF